MEQERSCEEIYVSSIKKIPPIRLNIDEELESILFDIDMREYCMIEKSGVQAACSVHNVRKCRRLAMALVTDNGDVNKERLLKVRDILK